MSVRRSAAKVWDDPIARLLIIFVGVGLVSGTLLLYPQIVPVVKWAVPAGFVVFGASRLYRYGSGDHLSWAAGWLLTLGGLTYGAYLLVPMGELAGVVAQLVPTVGLFVELFADQYRDGD